jgi:hypothetical protein
MHRGVRCGHVQRTLGPCASSPRPDRPGI